MGPRWQTSQLQLDLDLQYMIVVAHQQAKRQTRGAMTAPRLTIKDQRVGDGPIPGNLSTPFPK